MYLFVKLFYCFQTYSARFDSCEVGAIQQFSNLTIWYCIFRTVITGAANKTTCNQISRIAHFGRYKPLIVCIVNIICTLFEEAN